MAQAFRESLDPAAVRVKSLEVRLAQETQRCLQLEKQVQDLVERMLEMEKQMQALLGRVTHPIAQVRDLEPRIAEKEKLAAKAIQEVAGKEPRQVRRKV